MRAWTLLALVALLLGMSGCLTTAPPGSVSVEDHQRHLDYVAEKAGSATAMVYLLQKDTFSRDTLEALHIAYQGLTVAVLTADSTTVHGLPLQLKELLEAEVSNVLARASAEEFIDIVWREVEQRAVRHRLDDAMLVRFLIRFHQGLESRLESLSSSGSEVAFAMLYRAPNASQGPRPAKGQPSPSTHLVSHDSRLFLLTPEQEQAVVKAVLMEARGEGARGMRAVALVIRNRAMYYNQSPDQVVAGFPSPENNAANVQRLMDNQDALYLQARQLWRVVNSAYGPEDETGGALFFCRTESVPESWKRDFRQTMVYRHHSFFTLKTTSL